MVVNFCTLGNNKKYLVIDEVSYIHYIHPFNLSTISVIKIPIILNLTLRKTALFININLMKISHFTISKKKKREK